ncbi:hypothetical protein TELCIR_13689 [Teladorsagia circumcincta]|uniref:Uncharacterized protein n=1 Tax=Teladorsagia circumcincta TaxID=45464 RepID=A0A2G9U327_TELCI|nr:hypothetical protein TELCIR_13689 [Teladorsagia circumcincta]
MSYITSSHFKVIFEALWAVNCLSKAVRYGCMDARTNTVASDMRVIPVLRMVAFAIFGIPSSESDVEKYVHQAISTLLS